MTDRRRAAAPRHRLRHPARRPVPAPHGRRQRRHRAAAAGLEQGARPAARAMELLERVGLAAEMAEPLPRAALRRPAAARRRGPGAGRRPAGDADGRAVQRGRPGRARAAAGRVPAAAGASSARRSCSSPTTSTRRSSSATRSRVLRVGGKLAQFAEPGRAARPARSTTSSPTSSGATAATAALGFRSAGARCRSASEPTVAARRHAGEARRATSDGWVLVVDDDGRPLGWLDAAPESAPRRLRARDLVHRRRRSSTRARGSLRSALDAALSSPSGRGVVVDDDGAAASGTVSARRRAARRSSRRPARTRRPEAVHDDLGARQPRRDRATWRCSTSAFAAAADRDRAGARDAAGLAGQPQPAAATAPLINVTGLLYTIPSLALFVLLPAAARHPDPRPDQRRRRADDLHRRAARPHGRRRAGRRARRRRSDRRPRWATGRCAGSSASSCRWPSRSIARRPAGGRGVQRQPRHGRCADRRSAASASCSPTGSSAASRPRSSPASCWCCCSRWSSTG